MDFIKKFWDNQAVLHGVNHHASWGDYYAIELEINNISNHLKDGIDVLDVGCSNGFGLLKQSDRFNFKSAFGIDYSESMIKEALNAKNMANKDSINFQVGDIRKIEFPDNSFDVVYTTRVLINLPNWEEQIIGINECLRVTKPGGKVLLSEAFWEPLVKLNTIRVVFGLESLVEHDFNRYLKKSKTNNFLLSKNLNYEIVDFSSIYYLGSRLIRELTTDISKYEGYSNPINKIFYEIENDFSGGDVGIQQCYVINK
ncbi:MAG: methyltransferase domain-containing protein [Ignavibacteriae bacterium]|nr:methyltransferase domain-containing protein [Ignavibacteriota bacterium]